MDYNRRAKIRWERAKTVTLGKRMVLAVHFPKEALPNSDCWGQAFWRTEDGLGHPEVQVACQKGQRLRGYGKVAAKGWKPAASRGSCSDSGAPHSW